MSELVYNKKFEPLFDPPKGVSYFIITGGRYSSKSYSVSTAVCTLVNNFQHRALYCRYTLVSAKDSIIPEFQEKIDMFGLGEYYQSTNDRIVGAGKRKIVFKGIRTSSGNQTGKLKSLKDFSMFILDEAEEENDESSFDKISLSIRASDLPNYKILILNPTTKEHFIYKRFFEDVGVEAGFNGVVGNVCYIHTTYLDCLDYVPKDYLKEIEILKLRDPKKFEHIIMGGWLDKADGVIFTNWEYGDFDTSLPFGYGLDFGFFPDPDVLVKVALDRKNMKVYVKEEFGEYKLSSTELKNKVRSIVGSASVIADCAEPRLIDDIKGTGVNTSKVVKGAGSIVEGIRLMRDYKIIVDPSSVEIGKELNNYSEKNGEPIDAYNHRIDAIRYRMTTIIKAGVPRKGMTVVKYR